MNNSKNKGRNGRLSIPYLKYQKQDLESIKKAFSVKEIKSISDMFTYFDRSGQKFIKREDLGFALRALGYLVTTLEIREMAAFLDSGKTQKINFEQFLQACYFVRNRKPDQNEILAAIKTFENGKGLVNVQDLRSILTSIGDIVNQTEFETSIGFG
ncbi:hypothetical protein pb186bvf_008086 [Paramecium bursaria]